MNKEVQTLFSTVGNAVQWCVYRIALILLLCAPTQAAQANPEVSLSKPGEVKRMLFIRCTANHPLKVQESIPTVLITATYTIQISPRRIEFLDREPAEVLAHPDDTYPIALCNLGYTPADRKILNIQSKKNSRGDFIVYLPTHPAKPMLVLKRVSSSKYKLMPIDLQIRELEQTLISSCEGTRATGLKVLVSHQFPVEFDFAEQTCKSVPN